MLVDQIFVNWSESTKSDLRNSKFELVFAVINVTVIFNDISIMMEIKLLRFFFSKREKNQNNKNF